MKITRVETICLSRFHEVENQWFTARSRTVKADCAIVVIYTDETLQGIGEACAYGVPHLIRDWVNFLATELIGKDPLSSRIVPHPNGRSSPHDAAVGGIDAALWDLKGKIAGKPVCELLVEKPLHQVRLYASSGCRYEWTHRPEQLIDEALSYVEQGFPAMKFRLGTEWAWDNISVDRFLGLVRELSQAVAGRMQLMLDGNCRLSEEQALPIARELQRLGFAWFEEPMPKEQIDAYARLCAAVDLPISGGETLMTVEQFRPYLEKKAYDIVQPDAGWCGITESLRIAEMAQRYGVHTCPHSWHNGLMAMANAHLVAALPNPHPLELCMIQGPLQWGILAQNPSISNGTLLFPSKPGLGVDLAKNLEESFPYIEGHYALDVQH